jgi:hypothetical protein
LTHVPIFPDKASTQYAALLRTHQEQDRSQLREQTAEELPAMTTPKTPTHPFERSHSIVIAAAPEAVFDYVTNPKTWPQWLPSSHDIDCEDRPMRFGDTFHEHWSTRSGPVALDWLVVACERPRLWIGLTHMSVTGPINMSATSSMARRSSPAPCVTPRGRRRRRRKWFSGSMKKRSWVWRISRGSWNPAPEAAV